jgi:hypothetical protein
MKKIIKQVILGLAMPKVLIPVAIDKEALLKMRVIRY